MAAELTTLGWQVGHWIETLCCHGPGDVEGQEVTLDAEWLAVVAKAYSLDPGTGRRLVDRYVLSRAKGRSKSELAGWLCVVEALGPCRFDHWARRGETSWWGYEYETGEPVGRTPTYPFIRILATEEGQTGNTYDVVEYVLRHGPIVESFPKLDVGATRTFLPGGGEIRPSTAGAASKDGGKETFRVADEIHLYVLPEHRQMHRTVDRNLRKRKDAQPWGLDTTTMFLPGQGSVAEDAWEYHLALAAGTAKADPGFVFDHREGPEPRNWNDDRQLRASLKKAYGPAASWMDLDGIIRDIRRPMSDPADSRRYFLNRLAHRSLDNWLKQWPGAWERCESDLVLDDATDVTTGVDMALRHDSAAVVVAGKVDDRIVVRARIFQAPQGGKIDFVAVKNEIRRTVVELGARSVAYDPYMLELMAAELELEGVPMVETPQSPERMVPAFAHLVDLIVGGQIAHDGDAVFAAQIANAEWRETERGRTLTKRKGRIDACYALALACWELEQREPVSVVPRVVLLADLED